MTEKTETQTDDKIIEALIPPIKFIPVILGFFFAGQYLDFEGDVAFIYGNFLRSLIAFTIFWGLHRAIEPLSHMFHRLEALLSRAMVRWIFRFLRFLIIFIGGAVILEIWGIAVGPLLAGLGLFGAAVALGAQDLFKNLIGGLTVIAEKRFHPGEWIKVDGIVEGTVEDIGFRSTRIIRFDKAPVQVPNAMLSDAAVTNFSRMSNRRISWMIGVTYDTTTEQLKEIRDGIMGYIQSCDDFDTSEGLATFVRVDSFNASSIDIMVYCFTKTIVWGEWLEAKEKFAFEIKRVVEDAGTSFAFPSQSLYLESWPGETAEIFNPPEGKKEKTSSKKAPQ
jgi:MscS family membrane protein